MMAKRVPLRDRFYAALIVPEDPDACWGWIGSHHKHGYGTIGEGGREGRDLTAHRLSYEIHVGPIPDGMNVLHSCDNPPCSNPRHLFLGTQAVNVKDMDAKGRRVAIGPAGEAHPAAKLTDEIVRAIRERRVGGASARQLAAEYGVHECTVYRVIAGTRWSHLE